MPEILPLVLFAVAASITPGPNNMMIAANAAQNGVRAAAPHIMGINVGFAAMIVLVGLGVAGVIAGAPVLALGLRVVGFLWLLVLAWRIASAPPPGRAAVHAPMGFMAALLFQWVNPKAWMIALSVASAWVVAGQPVLPQLAVIGLVFLLVGPPCNLPWALLGQAAARLLGARLRVFNVVMAVLIVASMVPMLLRGL